MAVYTEVTDEELASFIASYGLGELLSYKGIAEGVENTNYLVHTEQGPVHPDALREARRAGRPAVLPRPDGAPGERGAHLPDARARSRRAAICASWRAGRRRSSRSSKACGCAARGRPLRGRRPGAGAAASGAAKDFAHARAQRARASPAGGRSIERFAARADEIAPGLAAADRAASWTISKRDWPRGLPRGVIHADLFPDNVFFLGDRLSGLIDFYFACNDALAYDVAVCLNAWCFETDYVLQHHQGPGAAARATRSVRPLTPAERAALPMLARGAALRFLLTRAYDWLNTPQGCPGAARKDPLEYLRRLRFHQGVRSIARIRPERGRCMSERGTGRSIYTDGACSGNPGPRRLGRHPDLRATTARRSRAAKR